MLFRSNAREWRANHGGLVAVGGLIGYIKKGSAASLIAAKVLGKKSRANPARSAATSAAGSIATEFGGSIAGRFVRNLVGGLMR